MYDQDPKVTINLREGKPDPNGRRYLIVKRFRYGDCGKEPVSIDWYIMPLSSVTIGRLNALKNDDKVDYNIVTEDKINDRLNRILAIPDDHHWKELTEGHI